MHDSRQIDPDVLKTFTRLNPSTFFSPNLPGPQNTRKWILNQLDAGYGFRIPHNFPRKKTMRYGCQLRGIPTNFYIFSQAEQVEVSGETVEKVIYFQLWVEQTFAQKMSTLRQN